MPELQPLGWSLRLCQSKCLDSDPLLVSSQIQIWQFGVTQVSRFKWGSTACFKDRLNTLSWSGVQSLREDGWGWLVPFGSLFLFGHRSFFLNAFPSVLSLSLSHSDCPYHLSPVLITIYTFLMSWRNTLMIYASGLSFGPCQWSSHFIPSNFRLGDSSCIDSFACMHFIIPATSLPLHVFGGDN